MWQQFSDEFIVLLCTLATWRISHFLVAEDGPGNIVVRLRAKAGDGPVGAIMDCFYCMSVWVAAPLAVIAATDLTGWLLCWLALSGGASLLEQGTRPKT